MNNKNRKLLWLVALFGAISMVGCNDDKTGGPTADGPLALSSFTPNYGKYLEKVILRGSGFSKPSDMKVYFNQRPAAVIGSSRSGEELYVLAPRLPGEDCVISVVKGTDSLIYDERFDYTVSTTVETICGNGTPKFTPGSLTEAQLSPYYVCVDDNDNIFVVSRNWPSGGDGSDYSIGRIDVENDELITLVSATGNVPCVAPDTQIMTCPTETSVGSFIEFNPLEMWAPRMRTFKWYDDAPPANGWKHCMVVNPSDGMIYTRFYYGQIIKIDPKTYETELVCKTEQFDTYGMTFRPQEPNVLYFTGWQNHGLFKVDLTAENVEAVRINSTASGFRDGDPRDARFNGPSQIFCDADGNMYIADCYNHCIRRMTPENQVETVLGVPGEKGWEDGTSDVAKFNQPRGIGVGKDGSVYVADWGNSRIRKLSIN